MRSDAFRGAATALPRGWVGFREKLSLPMERISKQKPRPPALLEAPSCGCGWLAATLAVGLAPWHGGCSEICTQYLRAYDGEGREREHHVPLCSSACSGICKERASVRLCVAGTWKPPTPPSSPSCQTGTTRGFLVKTAASERVGDMGRTLRACYCLLCKFLRLGLACACIQCNSTVDCSTYIYPHKIHMMGPRRDLVHVRGDRCVGGAEIIGHHAPLFCCSALLVAPPPCLCRELAGVSEGCHCSAGVSRG